MNQVPRGHTIAVRAYARPSQPKTAGASTGRRGALEPSAWTLTFDTETTTDAAQQLRFGSYQVRKASVLQEAGLFYDPFTLTENEDTLLQTYAQAHQLQVRTVEQFVEAVFFHSVADLGALCVGFPDAAHLSSWAGVCPGHKESVGKRLSGRSKHGNRYVRATLVQAAHGGRRSKTYLGECYRRLKKRRGSKRAALAIGHDLLVISSQMVKTRQESHEKGEEFFPQTDRGKMERRLVQRLERLGYQVTRQPQPAA